MKSSVLLHLNPELLITVTYLMHSFRRIRSRAITFGKQGAHPTLHNENRQEANRYGRQVCIALIHSSGRL